MRSVNGYAEMKLASFSQVDPSWLLHTKSFSESCAKAVEERFPHAFCLPCIPTIPIAQTMSTLGFQFTGTLNRNKLEKYLDSLLYTDAKNKGMEIFRMKGIVYLEDKLGYLLQAVHDVFEIRELELNAVESEASQCSKVIVIGKCLDEGVIRNGFTACLQNEFTM